MQNEHKHHQNHNEMPTQATVSHQGHVMNHGTGHMDLLGVFVVILIFISIGVFFTRRKESVLSKRYDLFKIPGFEKAVKSPYFSFCLRLIPALLFLLVIATGLFGRTRTNFAAPFTWLFWWTLLVFFVAFGGKIFCAACPWDFFANLVQFGWFHRIREKAQGLNIKWPKSLSNIYLAAALFVLLTWLELGAEVAYSSYATAVLGLIVVGCAILFALVFEKRAFCRYVCPVGRISGLYAQFSPIELRVKSHDVCKACRTKDCVKGGPISTPCPTGLVPYRLKQNTYCTLCTECVRSCDKNNLTLKLRAPGEDLKEIGSNRNDEVLLTFVILVLTFFSGLTMIPTWFNWTGALESTLAVNYIAAFSILMATMLTISYGIYKFFCWVIDRYLGHSGSASILISAFIPLILGYHVGHNTMHFLGEGSHLVPLINDPFGYGWNLFGFSEFQPSPLLHHTTIRWIQLSVIAIGFYFSVKALQERSGRLVASINGSLIQNRILFGSHYLLMFIVGLIGVWFVFQPMVMRSSY